MVGTYFQVSGNPNTDPKAAAQWLAEQRRRPIRAPQKTVQYGELLITSASLSSIPDEDLWSVLEQVAIASIECSRFDLAQLCISRVSTRFPTSQRVIQLQGMLLEGQANPSAALALYENALAKEPSLILSRRAIAALKAMGDLSSVVEALNRHLDTFYTDPEAWLELAEIYATQGMYIQSAFALEEVILQVAQNSFYHLKYAETLYTAGEVAKSYKAFLRVLEMCQSDGEAVETKSVKAGPWLRALWGTKMATTALIWSSSPQKGTNAAKDDKEKVVDVDKVKKIDELVTSLLLNKVYTSQNVPAKHLRDLARSVLAA
ncbi:uncharacterized protein MEPE_05869 [Melanopsichium pennsylvanicum]|uniref:ER membrane protein complex subunit 2 n=2 Tax=Melanopsichium pennsylvanicum TaxID=63383 RepID=A0AAJ4XQ98_9BASI|nr:uncharacterized protein MEPE_05869 [Melanopsichium pennsylvanicum]